MSIHNLPFQLWEARQKIIKAATVALLAEEVDFSFIKGDTSAAAVALTLPAANADMEGYDVLIVNAGAGALTVVCAAGFGGGAVTLTLGRGEMAHCICDGSHWYDLHQGAAA